MSTPTPAKKGAADKAPQDRLGKKPKVKETPDGKVITFPDIPARGRDGKVILHDEKVVPLSVTVPTAALDDFELLDELRAFEVDKNGAMLPAALRRLVGDDFRPVMDAIRDPDTKRVGIEPAMKWIQSLMEALNPNS